MKKNQIGIILKNIHTNKKFELWFKTEKDMLEQISLFLNRDFEFVERIEEFYAT